MVSMRNETEAPHAMRGLGRQQNGVGLITAVVVARIVGVLLIVALMVRMFVVVVRIVRVLTIIIRIIVRLVVARV